MDDRSDAPSEPTEFPTGFSTISDAPTAEPPAACKRCMRDPRRQPWVHDDLPRLVLDELVDLYQTVPLETVKLLTDQELTALFYFVIFYGRGENPMRLVLGAGLIHRKSGMRRGRWTPWLDKFTDYSGYSPRMLRRWMAEAREHYGLTDEVDTTAEAEV